MPEQNEQARRIRERLEALCEDSDERAGGGWATRMARVSAAIGMAAALGACYGGPPAMMEPEAPPPPPAPAEENPAGAEVGGVDDGASEEDASPAWVE